MKKAAIAILAVAFLGTAGLTACDTVKETTGVEFVNPYQNVTGFTDKAYVTIRLYEATLDSAIFACDTTVNPQAAVTPDVVCQKAAEAAAQVSPAVAGVANILGTYVYMDAKVNELMAAGKPVPRDILQAASEAFYKAKTEWADVETQIVAFNAAIASK